MAKERTPKPRGKQAKQKATFALLRGDNVTGETIAALYKQITGKTSTKEKIAEIQARLDVIHSQPIIKYQKKTTYIYRIIDGNTLARVELLDGKMTVNGAMIYKGEWFPTYPLDIIWEGRELTKDELPLIKASESLPSSAPIDTSRWAKENWVGQTPEQILGIARQAYTGFYEANT